MRLCFERVRGLPSIDKKEEFVEYFERNFPNVDYTFGGYISINAGDFWQGGGYPMWTVLMDDKLDLLAKIERQNWTIDGYIVHAYLSPVSGKHYKVPNSEFATKA